MDDKLYPPLVKLPFDISRAALPRLRLFVLMVGRPLIFAKDRTSLLFLRYLILVLVLRDPAPGVGGGNPMELAVLARRRRHSVF